MNKYMLFFLAIASVISIDVIAKRRPHPEQWLNAPVSTTSKVRITSSLAEDSLQHTIFSKILRRASIDTNHTSPRDIYSNSFQFEQYKYRFRYQLSGSTVIVTGEYGHGGLGGIIWTPITRGATTSITGTPWEQMDVMTTGLTDQRKEYSNQ